MQNVSALEIKKALAKKHGNREFFITECKTGPTGRGMLQFDGLAIYKSWARPNIVGYEIKTSRSDFLRDNKYTRHMPYCIERIKKIYQEEAHDHDEQIKDRVV
jgi:hypothetical protein